MIRYRRPKQDDPIILNLIDNELVPYTHMEASELDKVIKELPKRLTRGVTLVVSPYYEADPVAFIHFMIHGELLYIDMMAVKPEEQGKRHGKSLMAHAENFAITRECKRAKVMVDGGNPRAHLFYNQLSYNTIRYNHHSQCYELEKDLLLRTSS